MPNIVRKATLDVTAEELSAALGIPFTAIEMVEWVSSYEKAKGVRFTVTTVEKLSLPLIENKQKE